MRRLVLFLVTACVLVPAVPGRAAMAEDTEAQKAAKEIADARERANAANEAYFDAESELDALAIEAQTLEAEIADLQSQVDALQSRVQQMALNRFTSSSMNTSPLLNGFASPEEQMQVSALSDVISETSAADFDEFDSLSEELANKRAELDRKKAATVGVRAVVQLDRGG
ncbi:MAG: hypothetical protein ABMA25_20805, partial [Ilumatobacteraceae bacterium]